MSKKKPFNYYAVRSGRKPGIYNSWSEIEPLVKHYAGARYKGFYKIEDAKKYMDETPNWSEISNYQKADVVVYTDGGMRSRVNIGAFAFIIDDHMTGRKKFAKRAVPNVTNQQMELAALYIFLKHNHKYKDKKVAIVTDSKYLFHTMTSGWLKAWQKNNWIKRDGKPVKNVGFMKGIYKEIAPFKDIHFHWVKGHAKNLGNDYVDQLVNIAMDDYIRQNM